MELIEPIRNTNQLQAIQSQSTSSEKAISLSRIQESISLETMAVVNHVKHLFILVCDRNDETINPCY
jgi:hypothetical protein